MDTRNTLVTEVIYRSRNSARSERDVPVEVMPTGRNRTLVAIHMRDSVDCTLVLSGAERIALIEALGGTA